MFLLYMRLKQEKHGNITNYSTLKEGFYLFVLVFTMMPRPTNMYSPFPVISDFALNQSPFDTNVQFRTVRGKQ